MDNQAVADAEMSTSLDINYIGSSDHMMYTHGSRGGQSRAQMVGGKNISEGHSPDDCNSDLLKLQWGEDDDGDDLDALRATDENEAEHEVSGVDSELQMKAL